MLVSRIDRDIRPLFLSSIPLAGGVVPQNPLMATPGAATSWAISGSARKFNLTSQWRQQPAAFALRGMVKLPTGDKDGGASTGKADFAFDAIVSKEFNERVEFSGYGGFIVRGSPDEVETTNGFRWGFGAGMPTASRSGSRRNSTASMYSNDSLSDQGADARDRRIVPARRLRVRRQEPGRTSTSGSPGRARNGFFAGARLDLPVHGRQAQLSTSSQYTNGAGDRMDIVGRIGFHPGVRIYVPPPPPAAAAAAAGRPPAHVLSVRAACNPCTVEVGKTSTVSAVATSSIGCTVTYRVDARRRGTFTNPRAQNTPWTAPMQTGPVPVTVTVTCPTDGKTASDQVTIQVVAAAGRRADRLRGRALRLRPLQPAARSGAHARRGGRGAAEAAPTSASRSKATPATSARPNTTWRSASAAPTRCATTSSAAASVRTASAPSATVKSGRSTTTRAKRRVVSIAAPRSSSG